MENEYSGIVFYDKVGIVFSKDEKELIFENLKRILGTRRGERINNLAFGSDISRYLFMPEIAVEDLVAEVVNSISRCEPRVEVKNVNFRVSKNEDIVYIDLNFVIKSTQEIENLTIGVK